MKLNGLVYFRVNDGSHGYELWRTDATKAGMKLVIDLDPDAILFTALDLWADSSLGKPMEPRPAPAESSLFTSPKSLDADGFSADTELFAVSMK